MSRRKFSTKKVYLSMILLITSAGAVFFFPMNIGGQYTCFFHRIFDHGHPVSEFPVTSDHGETHVNSSSTTHQDMNNHAGGMDISETGHHSSELLDNYLQKYAFPWWASIGLLALCIYLLLKIKGNITENESKLTVKQ